MNINYADSCNFKPIPAITPLDGYWQNGTWKFNMSEITTGTTSQPSWIDIILHGTTALTLVNAKANGLNYLKLFGGTEQLPETYIDSVTAEGKCEQRNLPEGYTELEYIESSGTQYIDLGRKVRSDYKYKTKVVWTQLTMTTLMASKENQTWTTGKYLGITYSQTNVRVWMSRASSSTSDITSRTTFEITTNTIYDIDWRPSESKLIYNGTTLTGSGTQQSTSVFETANNMYLFAGNNVTEANAFDYVKMYYWQMYDTDGTTLLMNLVPCKNPSNVVGMYDTVNDVFYQNAGTGDFIAGSAVVPTPDAPVNIVCNNGAVKVSKNLFDCSQNMVFRVSGQYSDLVHENGIISYYNDTEGSTMQYVGGCFNAIVGSTYVINFTLTTSYTGVKIYQSDTVLTEIGASNYGDNISSGNTFTATKPYVYIYVTAPARRQVGVSQLQIEQGSTATPYISYGQIYTYGTQEVVTDSVGNTANAEILLAVGNYKDTQEILTGNVTRNVGIKILDGTESWTRYAQITGGYLFYTDNTITDNKLGETYTDLYCTHAVTGQMGSWALNICRFVIDSETGYVTGHRLYFSTSEATTVDGFKTWLATQYANGTPVIIVYPLATATTSSTTGQLLTKSPVTYSGSISGLTGTVVSSQHTTPKPTNPLQLNCNNGVVVLGAGGKNLLNINDPNETSGKYLTSTGAYATSSNWYTSDYILVNGVGKLTYSTSRNSGLGAAAYICFYNSSKTFISSAEEGSVQSVTVTIPNNAKYVRVSYTSKNSNWQLEYGESVTTYEAWQAGVVADGTTETVEVAGNNLLDTTSIITGYRLSNLLNNTYGIPDFALDESYYVSNLIPVEVGKTYIKNSPLADAYHRFKIYNANKTSVRIDSSNTITIQSGEAYIAFCGLQTELATAYCSEILGTAAAQDLYAVGTYKDVQSVLDGVVTRNVGVLILDGSEGWVAAPQSGVYRTTSNVKFPSDLYSNPENNIGICSHFTVVARSSNLASNLLNGQMGWNTAGVLTIKNTKFINDATGFSDWLSSQYNSGNPVIVIYPLATATTESVTGQPLTTQAGTNMVEITQASIDNLELEVSYKAGVEVTITEVQNAQLDNSVEVTIA